MMLEKNLRLLNVSKSLRGCFAFGIHFERDLFNRQTYSVPLLIITHSFLHLVWPNRDTQQLLFTSFDSFKFVDAAVKIGAYCCSFVHSQLHVFCGNDGELIRVLLQLLPYKV